MKWSIRKKLYLSFLIIQVLLILQSASTIHDMQKMGDKAKEIQNQWMAKMYWVAQLHGDLADTSNLAFQYIAQTDPNLRKEIVKDYAQTISHVKDDREQLRPLLFVPEGIEAFNDMETHYDSFVNKMSGVINDLNNHNVDQANQHMLSARSDAQAAMADVDKLIDIQKTGSDAATAKSVQLLDQGQKMVWVLAGISMGLSILVAWVISQMISKPMGLLAVRAEKIAGGDLTLDPLRISNRDEIGTVVEAFNLMTNNLRMMVKKVGTNSELVASSSEQLSASAEQTNRATEQISVSVQEMAQGTEKQVADANEVTHVIIEMAKGMGQVEQSIQTVAESSVQANHMAMDGKQTVIDTMAYMASVEEKVASTAQIIDSLGEKTKEIDNIVTLITYVSNETNLLSLNAAIEAARAGVHGRGFAVVADEVRKLAEQSNLAASQISELILKIQHEAEAAVCSMKEGTSAVHDGIGMVDKTGKAFNDIVAMIEQITAQSQEVNAVAKQVGSGSNRMVKMIEHVANISAQTAGNTQYVAASAEEQHATMEEISASAQALAKLAEELQQIVSQFRY
ncbi:MAG TPA: methyl-accepting chemotaxis protein [Bacillota bacterium]|nr:methyl-accepting chemotaxis protein [Bacillota bacterium]